MTLALSGERRRPVRQTISPDQFMSLSRVSAGLPKPSTDSVAKSLVVRGVKPLNSQREMRTGGFFLGGILKN